MVWDVFISHATEDKATVAEPLALALKDNGLSVWYDRFELRIGDRLRRSIDAGLSQSTFGVVILSPSFFQKHWPQIELDGLAQREVKNQKVILPVWYNVTAEDIRKYSLPLADRIAAQWSDGIDSVVRDILSVVKNNQTEPYNADGETLSVPTPSSRYNELVLLMPEDKTPFLIDSKQVIISDTVELVLVPANPRESAFLADLRNSTYISIGIAYRYTAVLAKITSVQQTGERGEEIWKLNLQPEDTDYGAGYMETAYNNYTIDDLAEMRARRILLDEKLSSRQDTMLEVMISGLGAQRKVEQSPLPPLYKEFKDNIELFLAAARLFSVLWLRLSGVVEHIFQIDLEILNEKELKVSFEGQRPRKYSNVDPSTITIEGVCKLK